MQNSKTMRLMVLALTAVISSSAHAVFTSVNKQSLTATAQLTGAGTFNVTTSIKNRTTNAAATNLSWTGVTAGSGWTLANEYIQLDTTITSSLPSGIQIYTDNTAAAANPKYTGVISANTPTPAGLVASANTTQKLPTAWRAIKELGVVTAAADPSAGAGDSFAWLFHKDKAQVAVPSLNATAFVNGEDFITVYKNGANGGVHFAQGPTEFGGFQANDRVFIYTGADFTSASTPNTYSTNQLIVESYTL